ncbi:MAG: hypothetical protein ACREUT_20285 [Steroidobacteraceae bacterium]
MADFTLKLGDFTFQDEEVPEEIAVGGEQRLVTKELIGGIRVVDAMGRIDDDLEWSGWLFGADAGARRALLQSYRVAGTALTLAWSDLRYQVIVKRFSARFKRQYLYAYQISFEVIADLTSTAGSGASSSIDEAVSGDLDTANTLASSVNDTGLTSLMSGLSSAVGMVASFSGASPSALNSVLQPLGATSERVATLQTSGDVSLQSAPGFAGIIAGGAGADMAMTFSAQFAAAQQLSSLAQLSGVLGRMNRNLASAGSSDNTVTAAGTDLFSLSASQYGDATDWTTIAQANGLTDPFVSAGTDLVIPPIADQADGVLAS